MTATPSSSPRWQPATLLLSFIDCVCVRVYNWPGCGLLGNCVWQRQRSALKTCGLNAYWGSNPRTHTCALTHIHTQTHYLSSLSGEVSVLLCFEAFWQEPNGKHTHTLALLRACVRARLFCLSTTKGNCTLRTQTNTRCMQTKLLLPSLTVACQQAVCLSEPIKTLYCWNLFNQQ